ncbi:Organic radical activating enzyme [Pasteurella testudinis DSM 23072]|uniref:7-carboxy-7-deazaguanine synthase n=1 Tax=Pasteurella testudinis DSM 23072 TaxID=1122938 RepID=A0A1W1UL58_9PAST|nr:7-carboxy-7-deazaguanine synthase QueE [Pasteurella testudinis]SMB81865.1 Organic radical activating enzyme [Pasteurella testudinis DSM 23072]SUB50289.1 7-cyano-7-deazaguanine synthase [Pasteurella testudinis]
MSSDIHYNIVEIFESLQGEGFNTGMPSIFIRFGKCNLACPWCDTDYHRFERWTLDQIMQKVRSYTAKNIIITGGEPTIQPKLTMLLDELKAAGYFLAIETNGLKPIAPQIDYIATSPKRLYQHKYQQRCIPSADEVRIVNDGEILPFCEQIEQRIQAQHYYLSPCEQQGEMNLLDTIRKLGELNQRRNKPKWQLSLQTHKLVGIE